MKIKTQTQTNPAPEPARYRAGISESRRGSLPKAGRVACPHTKFWCGGEGGWRPKPPSLRENREVTLAEVLDRVLDKGAVLQGDLTLRLADIDLIYVGLRVIITSISRMEKLSSEGDFQRSLSPKEREADLRYIQEVQREIEKASENIPKLIDASSPEKAEKGLAKLVLTLVKLLKDLMEKEATRQIEQGSLDDLEIQKLGVTFIALDRKMEELRAVFGLNKKDLNLDLGPLGRLM